MRHLARFALLALVLATIALAAACGGSGSDGGDLPELGAEEYFVGHAAAGPGLVFVEWGDRFADLLPPDTITVRIDVVDETRRRVTIDGAEF